MKLTDFSDDVPPDQPQSQSQSADPAPNTPADSAGLLADVDTPAGAHELNEQWEWSDPFTEFIEARLESPSLSVCTGLKPIADVNLDLADLSEVATSDNAQFRVTPLEDAPPEEYEQFAATVKPTAPPTTLYGEITATHSAHRDRYNGLAAHGDAFDLPFQANSYKTIIADPPWLDLSSDDRRDLFLELCRVCQPDGRILYNAPWKPESDRARLFELRVRQEADFWGNASFISIFRVHPNTAEELFGIHDYEPVERYPPNSPFWPADYTPAALSFTHATDPRLVSPAQRYQHFCCPICGNASLTHITDTEFETADGRFPLYQCDHCAFRVHRDEVITLATELMEAAAARNTDMTNLSHIDHTPRSVERAVTDQTSYSAITPSLPWVPR